MKWSMWIALIVVLFVVLWVNLCEPKIGGNPHGCKVVDKNSPMERACQKMGPYYDYRIWPGGRLEVFLNGKWLRLRY